MFNYSDKIIRIVYVDGKVWFVVVNDIGSILALNDTRKSVKLLDKDDRNTVPVMSALGRYQDPTIINEHNSKHGKNQTVIVVINKSLRTLEKADLGTIEVSSGSQFRKHTIVNGNVLLPGPLKVEY